MFVPTSRMVATMRAFVYTTMMNADAAEPRQLIEDARSKLNSSSIEGIWIDESDDASILRRRGGTDLLGRVRRGDQLVMPDVGTLARPLRRLQETLDHLVYTRGLTLHFVAEGFTFAAGGDVERLDELAELAYRDWRLRRTREGVARWKADGGRATGWAPYGERIVLRDGQRTTEGCWWERRWIKRIVEWRRAGLTYPQIVAELRRRKAQTSRGTAWNYDRVRRVITSQGAEKAASVGTYATPGNTPSDAEQRLCLPATTTKPARKRTSVRPMTFEVDGTLVKRFPKPRQAATETRREYRKTMRTMRSICRAIS
jgi:hypothetical protein